MSLRLKILAGFLTLSAVVLALSLTVVSRVERARVAEEANASLAAARRVVGRLLQARDSQLGASLRLLAGDFAFKQALATADPQTILSAAENHRGRIGSDLLIVTDPDGRVLADTRRRARPGTRLPWLSADGGAAARLEALDGALYQLVSVPVLAPDPIGVLAAGFKVDDELARSLKQMTGAEVTFVAGDRAAASTLDAADRAAAAAARAADGRVTPFDAAGRAWLAVSDRLAPGVLVVLQRSMDEALAAERLMRRLLLGLGVAGLLIAALIGTAIASGLTASLRKLARATRQVSQGRYDVALDIRSRDEVGELGRDFLAMARGLEEREKIRSVLNKTVSKEIAESLLAKGRIELGGEERVVTVLFCDIRSFTTISEGQPPQELVGELNAYFARMAAAIDEQHGVIDKFIGDAIMALFGAPVARGDDAACAVRAALAMRTALAELNVSRREAGLPPWEVGAGLNTGPVVAGTLGSQDRWSYTVIGDGVNLAARLEGLTKHYGAPIIVSESTRAAAGEGFAYRTLDRVVVKGRREPVAIFEVLAEGPGPSWLGEYERGLAACRSGQWEAARAALETVLAAAPQDAPARRHLERALSRRPDEPLVMTEK